MIGLSDNRNVSRLVQSYRDLDVYKNAFSVSLELHQKSKSFPQDERFSLTSQIRRASKGICANIAEGFAKQQASKAEFKRYLMMALGSAHEMMVWLEYCDALEYLTHEETERLTQEYQKIIRMLQKLYSNI